MSAHSCSPTSAPDPALPLRIAGAQQVPAIDSLSVCWGVSRMALGELAPEGQSALITLTLRIKASSGVSTLTLTDEGSGRSRTIEPKAQGPCELRHAGGLLHVASPHLHCFVRLKEREGENKTSPELVYARTTVLELLKLPGGRYQPLRVSIEA